MVKTELIHVRIDPRTKENAEKVFERLGINTSYAVSLFLNQVIMRQGLPFSVEIPEAPRSESVPVDSRKAMEMYAQGKIDYETAIKAMKKES